MTLLTLEQCEGGGNIVILAFHSQDQLPPFQVLAGLPSPVNPAFDCEGQGRVQSEDGSVGGLQPADSDLIEASPRLAAAQVAFVPEAPHPDSA